MQLYGRLLCYNNVNVAERHFKCGMCGATGEWWDCFLNGDFGGGLSAALRSLTASY